MARHSLKTESLIVTGIIGVLALLSSMTIAFILGMICAYLIRWSGRGREETRQ